MPYDYYDSDGYLAPGPTIPQWRQLRDALTGEHGRAFAESGSTDRPLQLADELEADTPLVQALRRAAESANTTLYISTGTRSEA